MRGSQLDRNRIHTNSSTEIFGRMPEKLNITRMYSIIPLQNCYINDVKKEKCSLRRKITDFRKSLIKYYRGGGGGSYFQTK